MTTSNVVSFADRRSKAEGWEQCRHGEIDLTVFEVGNGLAEVRMLTGSVLRGDVEVNAVQVSEEMLTSLIERATRVRDAMRAGRTT